MNRKELVEALRNGMYATGKYGEALIMMYPSNPIMKAAADEIEAMDLEIKDLLRSNAILADKYMNLRNDRVAESWDCYWD